MNIRRHYRAARRALSPAEQYAHACAIARIAAASELSLVQGMVGIYFANLDDGEIDTVPLIERLWSMSRPVALPVVARNHPTMDFYRLRQDGRLVENRFGILEPAPPCSYVHPLRLAVLFMPLVAFDASGNRVGMGLGYYDRYIARIPPRMRPRLVGLAHAVQESPTPLERRAWDVPLDEVITETGRRTFRHPRTH